MRVTKRIRVLLAGGVLLACACAAQITVNDWESRAPAVQAEHALLSGPQAAQDQMNQNAPPSVLVQQKQTDLEYSVTKLWLI